MTGPNTNTGAIVPEGLWLFFAEKSEFLRYFTHDLQIDSRNIVIQSVDSSSCYTDF